MTNHPNRSRASKASHNPDPAEVRAARDAAGLTQQAAADLIGASMRIWQDWEGGQRRMPWAKFELFCILSAHGSVIAPRR